MEVNFDKYLTRVARNCVTGYRCFYCDEIFNTKDEMIQHLRRPELDGGHQTGMLNTYNNLNRILNAAHPPTNSYNVEESIGRAISEEDVEESIGRAISEEVASNSEGEGDDPLCISSAERGNTRAMWLTRSTGPPLPLTCSRTLTELIVSYDILPSISSLINLRVLNLSFPRRCFWTFIPQSMSRFRLLTSLRLFLGATSNDIPQSMLNLRLLSEMEDNFSTYLIQVARNCGTSYICVFGGGNWGAIFYKEDEMAQHLCRAELDGGHETQILNMYNSLNAILAAARPPATSYNEEASIGRATSEEVASNSEGEGNDPPCISSAEKGKARAMELTCSMGPPFKRSRNLKNVVEESTVVTYDMKEHVPIAEEKEKEEEDVPKVASKIFAGNSEGEGDDPLCISSAKKGKARAMELTWPTGPPFKKPRHLKNVVEESTAVAYDIKSKPKVLRPSKDLLLKHIPFLKKKDVPFMLQDNDGFYILREFKFRDKELGFSVLCANFRNSNFGNTDEA